MAIVCLRGGAIAVVILSMMCVCAVFVVHVGIGTKEEDFWKDNGMEEEERSPFKRKHKREKGAKHAAGSGERRSRGAW